jgi:quercetin dioxygenase-like cupin family protein
MSGQGLIRNLGDARPAPVDMDGVQGVRMALMVGREHGAPNFALRQFVVEPGGHTPRHSHDYEHEVYIVEGTGSILLNGEERPIRRGDVIYVPADHEHQFKGAGEGLRFLCLVPVTRNCGDVTPGS